MELSYLREFQRWVSATPLTFFKNSCYDYVRWQNKALRFYIAARLLYNEELISPATFCAFQALENIMKATIMFYKGVAYAESFKHSLKKMERVINSQIVRKIAKTHKIFVPSYFVHERRFQSMSRYPRKGKGIGAGGFIIDDLDKLFFNYIYLVPFQFNTELMNILFRKSYKRKKQIICGKNKYISELVKYLVSAQRGKTADETICKLMDFKQTSVRVR